MSVHRHSSAAQRRKLKRAGRNGQYKLRQSWLLYSLNPGLGYGNDSRQNGPFGLRGSNSPLPEVISKIARAPPLVHDSAIYQQVRYQGEARFPNHSSADVIGSVTTSTFVDTNSARSRSLDLLRLRERLPSFSSSRPTVPSCHGTSTRMLTFSASSHSMRAGYRFGALEDVWVISDDSTFDSQECDLEEALTHIWVQA